MCADGPFISMPSLYLLHSLTSSTNLTLLFLREEMSKWKKHQVFRCNSKYGWDAIQGSILSQPVSTEEGSRNIINVTALLCHVHAEVGDCKVC